MSSFLWVSLLKANVHVGEFSKIIFIKQAGIRSVRSIVRSFHRQIVPQESQIVPQKSQIVSLRNGEIKNISLVRVFIQSKLFDLWD